MQDFAYLKALLNNSVLWLVRTLVSLCPKHDANPCGIQFAQSRHCFWQDQMSAPGASLLTQEEDWDAAGAQESAWGLRGQSTYICPCLVEDL